MAGEGVPIMTAMVESMGYGMRATVGEGDARVSNFFLLVELTSRRCHTACMCCK